MNWLLIAVLAVGIAWWLWHRQSGGRDCGCGGGLYGGSMTPGYTGTGDKTAQRPKARPWRG